jgi:hypothetical protein
LRPHRVGLGSTERGYVRDVTAAHPYR